MQIALIAFTVASILFGALVAKWHGDAIAQLRERHRQAWEQLGSPHSGAGGWTWRTLGFLLGRRFDHLGDPIFTATASRFRTAFLVWLSAMAAYALFAIIYVERAA